jgi:hypothetical protein
MLGSRTFVMRAMRGLALVAVAALLSGVSSAGAGVVGLERARSATPVTLASVAKKPATGPGAAIGIPLFPRSSPWNADVSGLPVHELSDTYLKSMGLDETLHADFGTVWNGAPNGIPYTVVRGTQKLVPITFYYADESDPGPYPIPRNAPIEGGSSGTGDRHILTLDIDNHRLYEVYDARYNSKRKRWEAGSGAIWDLNTTSIRPDGWTSADAAGLPMLPGLVRYDEVKRGEITHALRFTVPQTQRAYVYPASHFASSSEDASLPPMGLRLRLKADYDVSAFPADVQVILRALKKYGMIVADNGGPFYVSGAPDARWNDDVLHTISQVQGSDFEVVDASSLEPAVPLVWAGRTSKVRVRKTFSRWGTFSDPKGTAWTATVNYGDGHGTKTLTLRDAKRFRLLRQYTRTGTFRVTVTVRSSDGRAGSRILAVVVKRR